eukprot:scaffold4049_cov204-Alexandrium_tamarense.AAC.68
MASTTTDKSAGRVLLPPTINPTRYDLNFTPDLTNYTFSGITTIEVTTTNDVSGKEIVMHAKELCFASASFVVKSGSCEGKEEAVEINVNLKATTVTFVFANDIPKEATLVLTINYQVRRFDGTDTRLESCFFVLATLPYVHLVLIVHSLYLCCTSQSRVKHRDCSWTVPTTTTLLAIVHRQTRDSSTTKWQASTEAATPTSTVSPKSWLQPSSKVSTPDVPSPAGMNLLGKQSLE